MEIPRAALIVTLTVSHRSIFRIIIASITSIYLYGCESGSSPSSSSGGSTPEGFTAADAPVELSVTPVAPAELIDPIETNKEPVAIYNGDGQISLSTSGDGSSAQGWSTVGECGNGNVGLNAGGGKRHFLTLNNGCEITQVSESVIERFSAISLQFAISADGRFADSFGNPSSSLVAEILGVPDGGNAQVLQSRNITLDSITPDWQQRQVLLAFDELTVPENVNVGVRFRAVGDVAVTWYLSDVAVDFFKQSEGNETRFADSWAGMCSQVWVGSGYWANRNRDWHVANGRLESRNGSDFRPLRTVHRITSYMSATPENFELSVNTGAMSRSSDKSFSGILLGAGNGLDYRAAALIHNRSGRNGGLIVGVRGNGQVFLHDNGIADEEIAVGASGQVPIQGLNLRVSGEYLGDSVYRLFISTADSDGEITSSATAEVPAHRVLGNIGLVSNPGGLDTEHWFDRFRGVGAKLQEVPERVFGPVLMSTYTISRNELTLNAQFPQMCINQYPAPKLSIMRDDQWVEVASVEIDPAAFVSRLTVPNWDASSEVVYRIELGAHFYYGTIQAEPTAVEDFVLATYNCRPGVILSDEEGWIQQNNQRPFTWSPERFGYPHAELMSNAAVHRSHMLAFLGDQIYEFDPNGFIDKTDTDSLIEDYLWKWQQFIFTVREYTRNTPSFVIPDDHDVFQGNVWGAGGVPANEEGDGGFVFPSEFVQIVQKTQTGSLPRSSDTAPVAQGIDVYFTDIVYGGVGIAVLEDRKFKSSPSTDNASARLLGDRQLSFLDSWARDWDKQKLKLVVSQSPFAQGTTHSGADGTPNRFDKDTNGWPKVGRDRAVSALRRASAPHVAGDQHLGMSIRHGVSVQNDAVYSFAGPSMLNIFPRIWDPQNQESGPGDKSVPYLGEYTDAHGNLITVLAAANPDSYYLPRPEGSWQKDQLGIGYGIVRMDKAQRSYEFAAWPASVEPLADGAAPYADWPIRINQADNDGRTPSGYLPPRTAPVDEPVVVVTNEQTQELVYARRYASPNLELPIFDISTSYTVELSDPATGYNEVFPNQIPSQ